MPDFLNDGVVYNAAEIFKLFGHNADRAYESPHDYCRLRCVLVRTTWFSAI